MGNAQLHQNVVKNYASNATVIAIVLNQVFLNVQVIAYAKVSYFIFRKIYFFELGCLEDSQCSHIPGKPKCFEKQCK